MDQGDVAARTVSRQTRDPRALRTRRAILEAAHTLFARGGDLSVADLAREAGVSRATLYTHFTDVGDIAVLLVQEVFARIAEQYEEARTTSDPAVAMRDSQDALAAVFDEHRDLFRGLLQHPAGSRARTQITTQMAEEIGRVLARRGAVPDGIDPAAASVYIAHGACGLLFAWVLGSLPVDRDGVVAHLLALMPPWLAAGV